MTLVVHQATVVQVEGRFQGQCSALDFTGQERATEAAALADLQQHLADKQLVTHRSGRYTYRVVHADGTAPLTTGTVHQHARVDPAPVRAASRLERPEDRR